MDALPARRPPYTVVGCIAVVAAALLALLIEGGLDRTLVAGGLVLLLASIALLRGSWPAWLFLTMVAAGDLIVAASTWPAWWAAGINGIMLIRLVSSATRRYVSRGRPRFGKRRPA